jgi:hypothetical protein
MPAQFWPALWMPHWASPSAVRIEVRVGHDDGRVLAAELERAHDQPLGTLRRDALAGGDRAGEHDRVDRVDQRATRRSGPLHQADEPRRQDLSADLGQPRAGARRVLGGLEHHRVAAEERGEQALEEVGERIVPGGATMATTPRGTASITADFPGKSRGEKRTDSGASARSAVLMDCLTCSMSAASSDSLHSASERPVSAAMMATTSLALLEDRARDRPDRVGSAGQGLAPPRGLRGAGGADGRRRCPRLYWR